MAASLPRHHSDYLPARLDRAYFTPPASVQRELVSPKYIDTLAKTATETDFSLLVVRHRLHLPDGSIYPAPLDLTGSFTYGDARITGPFVASQLSHLAKTELTDEQRILLVKKHFGTFLHNQPGKPDERPNVSVLLLPGRLASSPSHQGLIQTDGIVDEKQPFITVTNQNAELDGSFLYVFAYGEPGSSEQEANKAKAEKLMADEDFNKLEAISKPN